MKRSASLPRSKGLAFSLLKIAFLSFLFVHLCYFSHAQSTGKPSLSVVLLLNPSGGNQNTADGAVVVFDDKFTAGIGKEDSRKLENANENLAINRNGTLLSIEGRPLISSNDTLHLKAWKLRYSSYWLKLTGTNFNTGITAVVKDNFLQVETFFDLTSVTLFPFSITADPASFASDRFSIMFKSATLMPVILSNVKAYNRGKGIQVDWLAQTETNIKHYEIERSVDGWSFNTVAILPAKGNNAVIHNYTWFDGSFARLEKTFYRVKAVEKSGMSQLSAIVSVQLAKRETALSVFPNPVTGEEIGLQLSNAEKGRYLLSLYNAGGLKVYAGAIEHGGGSASHTVFVGKQLAKGIYRLVANNRNVVMHQTVLFK